MKTSVNSDSLNTYIDRLESRFPFIKRRIIGYSVMNRPIWALSVGSGPNEVMLNAAHHANEWITTPVALDMFKRCAACHAKTANRKNTPNPFAHITLYAVPMVNPDGVDLVTGHLSAGSGEYINAKSTDDGSPPGFPLNWKANIRGVDLNSNYPAGWAAARAEKEGRGYIKAGPREYPGPCPLSEPETQALAAFTRSRDFKLTLSYHTQGRVIYWRYRDFNPAFAEYTAGLFSRASGYALEDTPDISGDAGYKDWFIQEFNRPGFTIECGLGENPLPVSQLRRIRRENLRLLSQIEYLFVNNIFNIK